MAGGKTLTAANSVLMLSIAGLFDVPQQLQGFAVDDVYDVDAIDSAEIAMGVDGNMSAGWVPKEIRQGVTLQADSDSIVIFEAWYGSQQAARELYFATGSIYLPAVKRKYAMTKGVLQNYMPIASAKKILQPRKFILVWESISQAAI